MRRPIPYVVVTVLSALTLFTTALARSSLAAAPSPAYAASLRRTAELRKQRRRTPVSTPVGVIVPYPMPPALVIRQTPEVHDEIAAFLRLLRGWSR
jgi:hypothetical protein